MKHISLLLLPVLLLLACNHPQPAAKRATDDKVPVRVLALQPHNGTTGMIASGQFTTDDETFLSFKTGGVIDRIFVKEGDAIREGQVLAILKLTEIDAQVQQATLGVEKARRDNQRTANLYKDSVATLEQLQNSKTALDLALQQLEAAKFNRSYSEIRAAKSGYVLRRMASDGQLVGPGAPVFQVNGAAATGWLLRVGVSDRQWAAIKAGNTALVTTDAAPGKQLQGTVLRKSQGVDPVTGLFSVDIKVANTASTPLAGGMYGKATINTGEAHTGTVWQIPYDALLDADGSMGYVFVTNDDATVSRIKVTIQGMEKDSVLISDGLQDVKSVIISGSAYLNGKSAIRIIQ